MKKWIVTLAAMSIFAAFALPSFADDKSDIKALYVKLTSALKAKSADGIMKLGTKDFSMTEKGQTMDAKMVATQLKAQFQMIKSVPVCTAEAKDIKVTGKTATVKSKMHSVMMMAMPGGKPGKLAKMESFDTGHDTLEKTAEGWKFKNVTSDESKMTMDGKPFDPAAMAPPAKKK